MLTRKYITEYAIGYQCSHYVMLTAQQISSDSKLIDIPGIDINNCHIYIITARPMPYFVPESISYKNELLSGTIAYKICGNEKSIEFSNLPFKLSDGAKEIIVEYPYRELWTVDSEQNRVRYLPATYLASIYGAQAGSEDLNSFEVLYIGQAYGNGSRSAHDRLKSHSTLQKILAKTQHDEPDKEINVFLLGFEDGMMFASSDGSAKNTIVTDENENRLFRAIDNPPTEKQKISIIEAGLIRYFQPEYNKVFKTKFPSTKTKTLESCKKLEISGISVEVDTSETNQYLYSKSVKAKTIHFASYDLFTTEKRASFFTANGRNIIPGVIEAGT